MDINKVKLKRLTDHIDDDGILTPGKVADILKAKPENLNFLRDYVKAAAEELKQPEVIAQFEASIKAEADAAAASGTPAATPEPVKTPPVEGEIQSEPEATATPVRTPAKMPVQTAPSSPFAESDAPTATPLADAMVKQANERGPQPTNPAPIKVASVKTEASAQAPGGTPAMNFRYRAEDGTSRDLRVVHVSEKTGTILLADKPSDELVTVTLRGQSVELNLTQLRTLPGGDSHTVNGHPYMVATLLVLADAAKA